jgi:hypothetical protein
MREMRQNALPILEAAGVDLVLTGHSHSYERSFLIDGHYGLSSTLTEAMKKDGGSGREEGSGTYVKPAGQTPRDGAVYAVAGSSGKIGGGSLDHPAMFVSLNVLGSMAIDIDDNRLDARFIDNTGAIRDYFTIVKGVATSPEITTETLPDGSIGAAYSATLSATGGAAPYTWGIASGSLPAGLALNPGSGVISGTSAGPAATSTFEARVTGADAGSSTRALRLRVISSAPVPGAFGKSTPSNNAKKLAGSGDDQLGRKQRSDLYEYCYDTSNNATCNGRGRAPGTARQAAIADWRAIRTITGRCGP